MVGKTGKMTLEKLALITAHGFDEVHAEINNLRKEVRAEFKLVHQELKFVRDGHENHERRVTRLEEKVL